VAKFTVQYRLLKTEDLPANSVLKNMIVQQLRELHQGKETGLSAKSRIVDIDQDGSVVILNKVTDPAAWDEKIFGGQLIQLEPGANVPAVLQSLDEDADEFLMEQIALGEDAQLVKGILYFAVVGNHVGLIEGQAVKGRTLERYLTNFLQRNGIIEAGQAIILLTEFVAADGKQLGAATSITISAEPSVTAGIEPGAINQMVGREVEHQRREGATVLDVLRTLGWSADALQKLEAEVPEGGWLEGFFSIIMKQRRRKKPISRATINEALRNIDASDIGLDGEGREKGGMRKISAQRAVRMIGSLKDPEDAIEQIVQTLREWAEKGTINCDFA
jgi:hypothetical protein